MEWVDGFESGTVAIVGAGLAGATLARRLRAAGRPVVLFDKGRKPGGRLAHRRSPPWQFDHGAQFVTARDPNFAALIQARVAAGDAAVLTGRMVRIGPDGTIEDSPGERFVGVPGMRALIAGLAEGLDIRSEVTVTAVQADPAGGLRLLDAGGGLVGRFRQVAVAVPSVQAVPLLAACPRLADQAAGATMAPCQAVMLGFDRPLPTGWDAAFVADGGPLGWVSRDSGRPGRDSRRESWVLHGSPAWSALHLEDPADVVIRDLTAAFAALTGLELTPAHAAAHRWRYALPTHPLAVGSLWDPATGLGACGDWCVGARAEAAFLSGVHLADRMTDGLQTGSLQAGALPGVDG
jgi:renalase